MFDQQRCVNIIFYHFEFTYFFSQLNKKYIVSQNCYALEYNSFELSFHLRAYKWTEWSTKSSINMETSSQLNMQNLLRMGQRQTCYLRLGQVIFCILVELMVSRQAGRVIVSLIGTKASQRDIQETNASLCSLIFTQIEDCLFVNERPWEDKHYLQPSSLVPTS